MKTYQELTVSRNEPDKWREGTRKILHEEGTVHICKGLEGRESRLPETTSKSKLLRKTMYLGGGWNCEESVGEISWEN